MAVKWNSIGRKSLRRGGLSGYALSLLLLFAAFSKRTAGWTYHTWPERQEFACGRRPTIAVDRNGAPSRIPAGYEGGGLPGGDPLVLKRK